MKTAKLLKRMLILMGASLLVGQICIFVSFGKTIYNISTKAVFRKSFREDLWWNYSLPPDRTFITKEDSMLLLNVTPEFTSQIAREDNPLAVKSVVFLKTHKTASSTLQNIFFRYASFRNLSVAIPRYQSSYFYPVIKFHSNLVLPGHIPSNFLLHHTILDMGEINKAFGSSFRVTILRDPVELFLSAFSFYGASKCFGGATAGQVNLSKYRELNISQCSGLRMQIGNMQAYDLGFPLKYATQSDCYLNRYLNELDHFFNLVLITEMFDESLIVMKHMLKWTLDDLVYFKHQVQTKEKVVLRNGQWRKIDEFNRIDRIIYEHFKKKLINSILNLTNSGVHMKNEISALRILNKRCQDQCIGSITRPSVLEEIPQLKMFSGYGKCASYRLKASAMNNTVCRALALPELSFDKYIKGRWASEHWKPLSGLELGRLILPILNLQSKQQISCTPP